jgi:hypothetical protein
MTDPSSSSLERAVRLTDLAHNVPQWLVGHGVPPGVTLFDLLEEYALFTGCTEEVAREFERVGANARAERLLECRAATGDSPG